MESGTIWPETSGTVSPKYSEGGLKRRRGLPFLGWDILEEERFIRVYFTIVLPYKK